MSTISFKDFTLTQTVITGRRSTAALVDEIRPRYSIDPETRQRTDTLDGYTIDILAARGKIQSVKLPLTVQSTAQQIADALKERKIVKINFGEPSTLRGRCYALNNGGQLLQGVSCTASELNVISIENADDDLDDFDEITL